MDKGETAELAFERFNNIEALSGMQISIINRYDLGLAAGDFSQSDSRNIEDWQVALAE